VGRAGPAAAQRQNLAPQLRTTLSTALDAPAPFSLSRIGSPCPPLLPGSEVVLVDFRLPSPPSVPSLVPGLDPAPAAQDPPAPNGGGATPSSNGETAGGRPAGPRASIDGRGSVDGGALSPFPLVRVRNVYVLPGIPALLRKKWQVRLLLLSVLSPAAAVPAAAAQEVARVMSAPPPPAVAAATPPSPRQPHGLCALPYSMKHKTRIHENAAPPAGCAQPPADGRGRAAAIPHRAAAPKHRRRDGGGRSAGRRGAGGSRERRSRVLPGEQRPAGGAAGSAGLRSSRWGMPCFRPGRASTSSAGG
jgi:hypothetical protein